MGVLHLLIPNMFHLRSTDLSEDKYALDICKNRKVIYTGLTRERFNYSPLEHFNLLSFKFLAVGACGRACLMVCGVDVFQFVFIPTIGSRKRSLNCQIPCGCSKMISFGLKSVLVPVLVWMKLVLSGCDCFANVIIFQCVLRENWLQLLNSSRSSLPRCNKFPNTRGG